MILIKGRAVKLEMADGSYVRVPVSYGMIHDPDGGSLGKCFVFVGPYKTTRKRVEMTGDAKSYFGPDYEARGAVVDVPSGPWNSIGDAVQIFYQRPGKHAARYYHLFDKRAKVSVARCRRFLRIDLGHGCIANWRGFVYP